MKLFFLFDAINIKYQTQKQARINEKNSLLALKKYEPINIGKDIKIKVKSKLLLPIREKWRVVRSTASLSIAYEYANLMNKVEKAKALYWIETHKKAYPIH